MRCISRSHRSMALRCTRSTSVLQTPDRRSACQRGCWHDQGPLLQMHRPDFGTNTDNIVQKIWGVCHIPRGDRVSYHGYISELTYLFFKKIEKLRWKTSFRQ